MLTACCLYLQVYTHTLAQLTVCAAAAAVLRATYYRQALMLKQ